MTSVNPLPDRSEPVSETKRSGIATGCGVLLILCVALFVWGSIRGTDTKTNASNADPDQMQVRVELMKTTSSDKPGAVCRGIGNAKGVSEGGTVSITNVQGAQDIETILGDGGVNKNGFCEFSISVPLFDAEEYLFGFDNTLFVKCNPDAMWKDGTTLRTHLLVTPNAAYCQPQV